MLDMVDSDASRSQVTKPQPKPVIRLLFVTWDGPQVSYLESLFLPIFAGLREHGFHFDILQFRWGDHGQEEAVASICREAGFGYRAVRVWRWGGAAGPFASAVLGGLQVRRAIRDFQSEVIMPRSVMPSLAVLAARGARLRPVLLDSDGLEIDERVEFSRLPSTGPTYRILREIEAQMVRLSTRVLVRTPFGRNVLMARAGPLACPDAFHIVSNGRDEMLFHPFDEKARQAVRSELGIPSEAPLVLYVGSVGGGKYMTEKVGLFARELRKLRPDTRLLILSGSPDAARDLMAPFPELENVTTIMRAAPALVARYIAAADVGTVFIKPTFSMRAAAPIKTGEYLLCGVPVVGTAEVGNNGIAISEEVFFDEARGIEAAARWALEAVMTNRGALRERARAVGVAHFSIAGTISGYLAALAGFVTKDHEPK